MTKPITSFSGEYRWLSNFWPAQVELDGVIYPSVEHAYQAAKAADDDDREPFQYGTAGHAKRMGRRIKMRSDWEQVKMAVMADLIAKKFAPGTELAARLLATQDAELVEGNTWNDTFWGVCDGIGHNYLGKFLMARRAALEKQ